MLKKIFLIIFLCFNFFSMVFASEKPSVRLIVKGHYARQIYNEILSSGQPRNFYWTNNKNANLFITVNSYRGAYQLTGISIKSRGSYRNRVYPLKFQVYARDASGRIYSIVSKVPGSYYSRNYSQIPLGDIILRKVGGKRVVIDSLMPILLNWKPPKISRNYRVLSYPIMKKEEIGQWKSRIGQLLEVREKSLVIATLRVKSVYIEKNRYYVRVEIISGVFDGKFQNKKLFYKK